MLGDEYARLGAQSADGYSEYYICPEGFSGQYGPAELATHALGTAGKSLQASQLRLQLTLDLLGWFTGASAPETTPAPENPVPLQRVLAIGDSTMAGVDRTFATGALRGASFDFRARSCRRLVRASAPANSPNDEYQADAQKNDDSNEDGQ